MFKQINKLTDRQTDRHVTVTQTFNCNNRAKKWAVVNFAFSRWSLHTITWNSKSQKSPKNPNAARLYRVKNNRLLSWDFSDFSMCVLSVSVVVAKRFHKIIRRPYFGDWMGNKTVYKSCNEYWSWLCYVRGNLSPTYLQDKSTILFTLAPCIMLVDKVTPC